jgi:hypothetical protein
MFLATLAAQHGIALAGAHGVDVHVERKTG